MSEQSLKEKIEEGIEQTVKDCKLYFGKNIPTESYLETVIEEAVMLGLQLGFEAARAVIVGGKEMQLLTQRGIEFKHPLFHILKKELES